MKNYQISDLSVHEALERVIDLIENPVAVVRNVDGSRSISELSKIFDYHKIDYRVINENLCLFKRELLKAIKDNVFTGFDEVWIFKDAPPKTTLKNIPYSTGDAIFNKNELDKEIYQSFQEENCLLLLADGVLLHYLSFDPLILSELNKL